MAAIRAADTHPGIELYAAEDGSLSGAISSKGVRRQLASRYEPLIEAMRLAGSVDVGQNAAVLVRGFGCGHHVAALAGRLKNHGAIFVFEPDVALLRAVLERVDCTPWLAITPVVIFSDEHDHAALSSGVQGLEGLLAAGITILDHPASRARLHGRADEFAAAFTGIVKAVRTHVVTTLVQVETTVRNGIQNLKWYASAPGVRDLAGCAPGVPAVVVSAGPSLHRNVALLAEPGVRDRVVIIAVQTALKTLLAHGIKPHFVTALDYHEISRRFYEGLTAQDVEGVTLVAEPKCSPAILEAWPGALRCVGDEVPDRMLGSGLVRDTGRIQPGATVAHLAYYLARHMGCDPVMLIGQDLGFTDGQYYAPGAAIHGVWAGELNAFNTLEMLEWQRIARMKSLLRPVTDINGRPIYTDEQMATYLVQFERDFARDEQRGLTTIDATEGGVRKKHARAAALREALAECVAAPRPALPPTPAPLSQRARLVEQRLSDLRRQAGRIERLSTDTARLLREMRDHHSDQARVNRLIERAQTNGREVAAMDAYWLVQFINQTGQLKRFRTDRSIDLESSLSELDRQQRRIDRDIENVTWLGDAARQLGSMLEDGVNAARGQKPITRDPSVAPPGGVRVVGERRRRVAACIPVDGPAQHMRATLARLSRCRELDGVVLLSTGTAELGGVCEAGVRIVECDAAGMRARFRSVAIARAWSRHCWRGGIANLSVYDEAYCPGALAPIMAELGLDAAAIIGADWLLIDPCLVDAVVSRYRERPDGHTLTFTQAPPGLGACVVARHIVEESARAGGPHATVGGLLGYIPIAPQADPIAKPVCPSISPRVRDLMMRCIPDSPARAAALLRYASSESADDLALAAQSDARCRCPALETLTIDARYVHGATPERIGEYAAASGELAVTIDARHASPRVAAAVVRTIGASRSRGLSALHVRTTLSGGEGEGDALLESGADVISIDVTHDQGHAAVEHLLKRTYKGLGGLPERWIVPRMTRSDATYARIERFYDRWLLLAGACVIDPLPAAVAGDRIAPLPEPACVRDRRAQSHVEVAA